MDYPRTGWVFFRDTGIRLEDALRTLTRRGLDVNFTKSQVEVELPCGRAWVSVTLQRGPRVRQSAAKLAEDANPAWGWQLAKCESAFVVKCCDRDTTGLEVLEAWEEVVALLQAATAGFRYTYSDPDSDHQLVPPIEPTG